MRVGHVVWQANWIVILSEVVVCFADDNAVEGPRASQTLPRRFSEFLPPGLVSTATILLDGDLRTLRGILRLGYCLHSRINPFAQDDRWLD